MLSLSLTEGSIAERKGRPLAAGCRPGTSPSPLPSQSFNTVSRLACLTGGSAQVLCIAARRKY